MPRYRRAHIEGGCFFFTVALADRSSDILVRHIDRFRRIYKSVEERFPFRTVAICVLPDHLHTMWSLPSKDSDFALRWNVIKGGFSRGLPAGMPRSRSKVARRERGIWQRRYWEHAIRNEGDLRGTSITFIIIQSSTDTCRRFAIGRIAAFIATSHVESCRWTGLATLGTNQVFSANDRVGKGALLTIRVGKNR
jgi:REP element-mobilizing transposase RayT